MAGKVGSLKKINCDSGPISWQLKTGLPGASAPTPPSTTISLVVCSATVLSVIAKLTRVTHAVFATQYLTQHNYYQQLLPPLGS